MAAGDDESPPTSPSNFNTLPLQMSGEAMSEASDQLASKEGLTEEELRRFDEIQASFDSFQVRQSEVERSVACLLERLNRKIQVPSSASSECDDTESLGRTEDGLSFLDSRLGSRAGTPLGGNSPLGSPRDRPTLGRFEMPSSSSISEHGRRDGTAPQGGERGDLRTVPREGLLPEPDALDSAQACEPCDACAQTEPVQAAQAMPQSGEPGELKNPEITPWPERPEVCPTSPSPARRLVDQERLPQFGSPELCDEEPQPAEEVEAPDDDWHGWTVVATSEGRLFFFQEERRISQWHQPAELDPILGVWEEACDETQPSRPSFWRNDLLRMSLWKNPQGTSNIFQAAMDGNLFFLQLYSQVNGDLDCVDHRACSALHYACAGGSAPSALFLLQGRAMVDRPDINLTTPLMLACRYGYAVVLKVLLDAQADPNFADKQGQSPLHQAAELGQLDCLHCLLLSGAQVDQRNHQGETALAIAQRKRHLHCMTLLRRHSNERASLDAPATVKAWDMPLAESESAPWASAYQEVAANDLVGFPERYTQTAWCGEADSGSESSDQDTEVTDASPTHNESRGLLSTLRRRLFPIRADLGLPNSFCFNKSTQRWELPSQAGYNLSGF